MVYTYIITIRKSQVLDYVSYSDLKIRIAGLCLRLPDLTITVSGFEAHGLYKQLHVHMLGYSAKRINYKSINKYFSGDRFIYHFKRATVNDYEDMQSIISYICKYDKNIYARQQILVSNYYRYHYGFD